MISFDLDFYMSEIILGTSEDWQTSIYGGPGGTIFDYVESDFIKKQLQNEFLQKEFPNLEVIVNRILGPKLEDTDDDVELETQSRIVFRYIHSLFLLTEEGQKQMIEKFDAKILPKCPRLFCRGVCCFPVGIKTDSGIIAKMICPICREIYSLPPPFSTLQSGDAFAEDWINSFFNKYKDHLPPQEPEEPYEARIFGFKVRHTSDLLEPFFVDNSSK